MQPFPDITGMKILSELGRDSHTRRYRLDTPDEQFLVVFAEPTLARAVSDGAKRFGSIEIDGFARVGRVIHEGGQLGIVVYGEIGESIWRLEALGEGGALPLLHETATIVASLHAQGVAHGMLKPDGITLLQDGAVMVLPPVMLPDFLYEVAGAAGGAPHPVEEEKLGLSRAARDLAALGHLACHLIAGLTPESTAGVGAVPGGLMKSCSPATAQAVRILLEAAGKNPSPSEAAAVLVRVGWARDVKPALAGRDRPAVFVSREGATTTAADAGRQRLAARRAAREGAGGEDDSGAPVLRGAARKTSPVLVATLLLVIGGALMMAGGGGPFADLWSGGPRKPAALPTPGDPLEVAAGVAELGQDPAADSAGERSLPGGNVVDAESRALADQILADLAAKRQKKATPRKRSFDRSLIDEGDRLRAEAQKILVDVRDRKVPHESRNAELQRAIDLLERSKEKYLGFAEQFESRERLVESSVEDVNSLIFFAYRQKTGR